MPAIFGRHRLSIERHRNAAVADRIKELAVRLQLYIVEIELHGLWHELLAYRAVSTTLRTMADQAMYFVHLLPASQRFR